MQKLRPRSLQNAVLNAGLNGRLALALAVSAAVVACATADKSDEAQQQSPASGAVERDAPAGGEGRPDPTTTPTARPADSPPADSPTATSEREVADEGTVRRPKQEEASSDPSPPPPVTTATPKTPSEPAVAPVVAPVNKSLRGDASFGVGGLGTRGTGRGGGGVGVGVGHGNLALKDGKKNEPRQAADVDEKSSPTTSTSGTFVHAGTNPFIDTATDALSTFAIDVDTGSFTFARRYLKEGNLPPDSAVRVEEWVNAMHYAYDGPAKSSAVPFAVHVAGAPSPIAKGKHLVRVALKGKEVARHERQPTSLVFLVDVSGSMEPSDRLPLAKQSLHMLVNMLREDDNVAIATYAGETRLALPLTSAMSKDKVHAAIDSLRGGGGTNMGSGLELAYREATKGLGGGHSARVIVLSDGDANLGRTSHVEMLESIKGYVSEGVMMSTVGFGTGNYNDHLMEQLADAGNGNYSYIDSVKTAEKVFVESVDGTLETIAQDVKIQVEWNKDVVARYRLVGYENRDVADQDFRNDKKDAGEIGAGHAVTALYEIELINSDVPASSSLANLGTVRIRAKKPRGTKADEIAVAITPAMIKGRALDLDDDAIAASAVALAAEILRGSPYAEGRTLSEAAELLRGAAVGKHAAERNELARELMLVEPRVARR